MRARAIMGWVVAAVVGFAWLGSDKDPAPSMPSATQTTTLDNASDGSTVNSDTPGFSVQPADEKAADPVPPVAKPATVVEILYAKANVRLRQRPSTDAPIVWTVPNGTQVLASDQDGRWRRVKAGAFAGWLHSDFLAKEKPLAKKTIISKPLVVAPKKVIQSRAGQPVRDPYVGTCDCPYDRMRNGRMCGGRSAYSRPGGRSPTCYF